MVAPKRHVHPKPVDVIIFEKKKVFADVLKSRISR